MGGVVVGNASKNERMKEWSAVVCLEVNHVIDYL